VKPVTGLLDFAAHTSQGFKSKRHAQLDTRVRPPRANTQMFAKYSRAQAMGEVILSQLAVHGKDHLEEFDHAPSIMEKYVSHWHVTLEHEDNVLIVLTSKRFFLLKVRSGLSHSNAQLTLNYKALLGESMSGSTHAQYQIEACIAIAAITLIHLSFTDKSKLFLQAKRFKKATIRERIGKSIEKQKRKTSIFSQKKETSVVKKASRAIEFARKMTRKITRKTPSPQYLLPPDPTLSNERNSDKEKQEKLAEYEIDCGSEPYAHEVVAAVQSLLVQVFEAPNTKEGKCTEAAQSDINSSVASRLASTSTISIIPPSYEKLS